MSGMGEDEPVEPMNDPGREFARLLGLHGTAPMHLKLEEFHNEHHVSVAPLALYHGLRHLFEGFEAVPGQFSERPETIIPHFETLSARLGVQILPPESLLDRLGQWELQKGSAGSSTDPEPVAKAIKLLETNVRFYPQSYHAHESLARAYEAQQHTASALEHYQRSLELNPGNEAVRERLLRLRQEHGDRTRSA